MAREKFFMFIRVGLQGVKYSTKIENIWKLGWLKAFFRRLGTLYIYSNLNYGVQDIVQKSLS